jgi:N-acyl amino acid synthase of PEP-CTERM/exosortase system
VRAAGFSAVIQAALFQTKKMRYFKSELIDTKPDLLQNSYNLRYQVYCMERSFLPKDDYPEESETDKYDPYSFHLGAVNLEDSLVGTSRLVQPSGLGLPMYDACELFTDAKQHLKSVSNVAEISRLCVSRSYRRRSNDGYFGEPRLDSSGQPEVHVAVEHRGNPLLVVSLYKAIYQTAKRAGITHLLAATEKSLQRLLSRYRFPFHAIGPEVDYFGPVTPYLLELSELDKILVSHQSPILEEFLDGLEQEFWPANYKPH